MENVLDASDIGDSAVAASELGVARKATKNEAITIHLLVSAGIIPIVDSHKVMTSRLSYIVRTILYVSCTCPSQILMLRLR
jgi:hypothetical protein